MIFAIIPVKRFENSKTRLGSMLDLKQRMTLSALLLNDTLMTLTASRCFKEILVVTGDRNAIQIAEKYDTKVIFQEKDGGVNSAVALADAYSEKAGANATIVVPQDLPLMKPKDVTHVCMLERNGPCITLCPSLRLDGTNILFRKPSTAIATHYDNNSYENHIRTATSKGIPIQIIRSKALMFDLDTPEDVTKLAITPDKTVAVNATISFIRSVISSGSR